MTGGCPLWEKAGSLVCVMYGVSLFYVISGNGFHIMVCSLSGDSLNEIYYFEYCSGRSMIHNITK